MARVTSLAIRVIGPSDGRDRWVDVEVRITMSLHRDHAGGLISLLDGALDILWQHLDYPLDPAPVPDVG